MLEQFPSEYFSKTGLNLQAVFNIDQLPEDVREALIGICPNISDYRQLILFGHGGTQLWEQVRSLIGESGHPIDEYSAHVVKQFFSTLMPFIGYTLLFPGASVIGLQRLGQLAGWHHPSPFRVGINTQWGSWFAYRAVVLANSNFEATSPWPESSPCDNCVDKPCVQQCPANALAGGEFDFQACISYRKQPDSQCRQTCLARVACPVHREHRYSDEQIHYHYSLSMRTIEERY